MLRDQEADSRSVEGQSKRRRRGAIRCETDWEEYTPRCRRPRKGFLKSRKVIEEKIIICIR